MSSKLFNDIVSPTGAHKQTFCYLPDQINTAFDITRYRRQLDFKKWRATSVRSSNHQMY